MGRYSGNFSKDGIRLIEPKDVDFLSNEIPSHDIYLTASRFEAGANHVLEGMAAGLPVLYRSGGGSIDEYCSKYGLEYDDYDSLIEAVKEMRKNFKLFKLSALGFRREMSQTIKEYIDIILSVS